MRILFVGTVEFSRHCLEVVLESGGDVVAVMTLDPERARFNTDFADLSPLAAEHGVPVHRIRKINDPENIALIREIAPDVTFVFGFSQLISPEILELPPLGCIGTHPALLPQGRGRHPLVWALVKGLECSGLTFFYLEEGADDGDILWQDEFEITIEDDAASLYRKIEELASRAIPEFLPALAAGTAPRIPQDDATASYWPKRGEEDGLIDWLAPTRTVYDLIRALTRPYVGAHTFADGHRALVWKSTLPDEPLPPAAAGLAPGTLFSHGAGRLAVRTGDGFLLIDELEVADGSVEIDRGMRLGS